MKRKVTVTFTKIRRQTALAPTDVLRAHCSVCEREVETISQAQAVELLKLAGQSLEALLAGRRVHIVEVLGDELRVCKDSLVTEWRKALEFGQFCGSAAFRAESLWLSAGF